MGRSRCEHTRPRAVPCSAACRGATRTSRGDGRKRSYTFTTYWRRLGFTVYYTVPFVIANQFPTRDVVRLLYDAHVRSGTPTPAPPISPMWVAESGKGDAKTPPKVRTLGGIRKIGVRRTVGSHPFKKILYAAFGTDRCSGMSNARIIYNGSLPATERAVKSVRKLNLHHTSNCPALCKRNVWPRLCCAHTSTGLQV